MIRMMDRGAQIMRLSDKEYKLTDDCKEMKNSDYRSPATLNKTFFAYTRNLTWIAHPQPEPEVQVFAWLGGLWEEVVPWILITLWQRTVSGGLSNERWGARSSSTLVRCSHDHASNWWVLISTSRRHEEGYRCRCYWLDNPDKSNYLE